MPDPERGPKGSNFLEKSRRFAKYAAVPLVASAALFSSCRDDDQRPIDSAGVTIEALSPTPEHLPANVIDNYGSKLFLNSDGLPEKLIDVNGNTFELDVVEAARLREKAVASKEPEILQMFPLDVEINLPLTDEQKKEHPVYTELPKDVVSPEELASYGIKIIQSGNSQLHIRKQALEEGGPLHDFTVRNRKLTIVLMDSDIVSKHYLSDPKYDEVREMLGTYESLDIVGTRNDYVKGYQDKLGQKRNLVSTTPSFYDEYSTLAVKSDIYWAAKLLSDERIKASNIQEYQETETERKIALGARYIPPQTDFPATIFLPMGSKGDPLSYNRVYFDSKGQVKLNYYSNILDREDSYPNEYQSHPKPEWYPKAGGKENDRFSYAYDFYDIGPKARHELFHYVREILLGLPMNEFRTDELTMSSVKSARETWVESDFKDDSGYFLVIKTPKDLYILTASQTILDLGRDAS